jgi:predicted alpha/beta-fold hydrolase
MGLAGHFWTVMPRLRHQIRPVAPPLGKPWTTTLTDPKVGEVRLTGRLDRSTPQAPALVVLVHGLGGCVDSAYMLPFVHALKAAGYHSLSLNLRGADRSGEDFYHAGLIEDLDAALASPEVVEYAAIYLVGFSLGGHLVLRWAVERGGRKGAPPVRAVAGVCSPMALSAAADAFGTRAFFLYRKYILEALLEIYEKVAERRPVPLPVAEARKLRSVREFDEYIVAPRHGFAGADDYYARMSVGSRLHRLQVPALWLGSEADPMVHPDAVRPSLEKAPETLTIRWTPRGGHVGFPADLDVGLGPDKGLRGQVLGWLLRQ